jgi:hypothetical protein
LPCVFFCFQTTFCQCTHQGGHWETELICALVCIWWVINRMFWGFVLSVFYQVVLSVVYLSLFMWCVVNVLLMSGWQHCVDCLA